MILMDTWEYLTSQVAWGSAYLYAGMGIGWVMRSISHNMGNSPKRHAHEFTDYRKDHQ